MIFNYALIDNSTHELRDKIDVSGKNVVKHIDVSGDCCFTYLIDILV
jgi:hypothetical protein